MRDCGLYVQMEEKGEQGEKGEEKESSKYIRLPSLPIIDEGTQLIQIDKQTTLVYSVCNHTHIHMQTSTPPMHIHINR